MHLDRAHADPEIVSDQLVRPAGHQAVKDVPLPRREARDPPRSLGDIAVTIGMSLSPERRLDRPEQSMVAVRFLQEIGRARLHRTNSRLNISLAGHDDNSEVVSHLEKLRLDIKSAHARQADIEQDTTRLERLRCRQKLVRMVESDRLEIRQTQQAFQLPKDGGIII